MTDQAANDHAAQAAVEAGLMHVEAFYTSESGERQSRRIDISRRVNAALAVTVPLRTGDAATDLLINLQFEAAVASHRFRTGDMAGYHSAASEIRRRLDEFERDWARRENAHEATQDAREPRG